MKKLLALTLALTLSSAYADEKDINRWNETLHTVQARAAAENICPAVINRVIQYAQFRPVVIQRDRNQPEFVMTLQTYLNRVVHPDRIAQGRVARRQNAALLREVERTRGVQSHVLLALWGTESRYGAIMGTNIISDAFLTLIYDGRRATFFTNQMLAMMRHADANNMDIREMRGSWAGAMGHFQFIPTTLARYGVDGDGDGVIDIMNSLPDAMHSAANYLARLGWDQNQRILRTVRLPANFDMSLCNARTRKELSVWHAMGVRNPDGSAIPRTPGMNPGMVCDYRDNNQVGYLVYENFFRLRRWNASNHFGVAIGLLADQLRE